MLADDFRNAMEEGIRRHKTQKLFAEASGIHQSRISAYATGKIQFEELSVSTLIKLFPDLRIIYFRDEEEKSVKNGDIAFLIDELTALKGRVNELEMESIKKEHHSRSMHSSGVSQNK